MGYAVYFDGSDSWDPNDDSIIYKWDFGDGISTDWQNNSKSFHIYETIGNYTVNLTISDGELTGTDTCIVRVLPKHGPSLKLDESPWPMFRGNALHTGLSPYNTSDNNGKLKWKFYVGRFSKNVQEASPVIGSDGTIYVGSTTYNIGYLYSIDRYGELNWKFSIGNNKVSSSPVIVSNGTIYMGSEDGNIYALLPNGTLKWKLTINSMAYSSLTIDSENTIYYGGDDSLNAIYPNGTQKLKFETRHSIVSSPTIGLDDTIYFHKRGPDNSTLYSINPNATLKWKYKINSLFETTPVLGSDGTIYIGSYDTFLYAIDSKGTLKWKFKTERAIHSAPAIGTDGTIYLSSDNFYAINPDGTQKWKLEILECGTSPPVIGSDGTVYVGGYTIKTTNTDSYSGSNYLFAINPEGTIKWKYGPFSEDHFLYSPAIDSDGTIYIGSSNEYLYAIGKNEIDTSKNNDFLDEDTNDNRSYLSDLKIIIITITTLLSIVIISSFFFITEVGKYTFFSAIAPLYAKRRRKGDTSYIKGSVRGYILGNPGERYNDIKNVLKLPNGTLTYYLNILQKEEIIRSERVGFNKRFYPTQAKFIGEKIELTEIQQAIRWIIKNNPGISQVDIQSQLGISQQSLNYHIQLMSDARIIRLDREGNKSKCFVIENVI